MQKKLINKIKFDNKNAINSKINLINNYNIKIENIKYRKKYLNILKSFLKKHEKNLTKFINLEAHKTINESKNEFNYALEFVDYSIFTISNYAFEKKSSKSRKIFYKSSGLVFAMTPYNDPLAGMMRKIAPSIAAGSTIIMKTSAHCIYLCKYIDKHLPKELKKIIQFVFIKNRKLIEKIVQNNYVKLVTFTGSTQVGLKLNDIKTKHLQKKILELGGINYAVIFDDKNLSNVIDEILTRKIKAAGQACSSINKLFVSNKIKKKFEKIVKEKVSKITCGSVRKKSEPDFGPVISSDHYNFLKKLQKKSIKNGYLICKSNSRNDTKNLFPLSLIKTSFNDEIFDNFETFGPLLGVSYFNNSYKVLKKISKSDYSLVCYLFTQNQKITDASKYLNLGSIGINTTKIQSPESPTGGNNLSGIGREGGIWGFEEFLTTVNYVIKA